jgi:hypothetical protein
MSCELNSTGNAQPLEINSAVPAVTFGVTIRKKKRFKGGAPCFTEH